MNHKFKKIIPSFLILALFLIPVDGICKVTEKDLEQEQKCGDYSIKVYRDKEGVEGLLKILKGKKEIYSEEGIKFRVGLVNDDMPEDKAVNSCKDMTGSGEPNLVVSQWSGGAHCCFTYDVFSLGKEFRKIASIDNGDGDMGKFVDVDHDGTLEFIGNDWTYAYWNTSFAGSPAPEVILKYRDGDYQLAMDLMKKTAPTENEEKQVIEKNEQGKKELQDWYLKQIAEQGKDQVDPLNFAWIKGDTFIHPSVWGHMLDLIYTGNAGTVKDYLDEVWPKAQDKDGSPKTEFFKEFMVKLKDSPYCASLKAYYAGNFPIECGDPVDTGTSGLIERFKRKDAQEVIRKDKEGKKNLSASSENLDKKAVFTDDMEEDLCFAIRAVAKGQSEAEIEHTMGVGLLNADNQWERAEKHFKKAVELDPKLDRAWYNLGLIHIDSEEGMGYFRKAIEANPNYSPAYYWIAYYYTRYGKLKEALPIWEDYLRIANAETADEEAGRIQTAEAVIEEIKSGKPGKELSIIHIK